MEKKIISKIALFCAIMVMMASKTSHATDLSPKAVSKWAKALNPANEKFTNLHFFLHHLHNVTAVTIARGATTDKSPTFFGLLDARDDPLTAGPAEASDHVGYAQGISAAASLQGISSYDPFTFVFTNEEYNGSTLSVLGSCALFAPSCEAAVVGGSGAFRLARGWVTTRSYYLNFTTGKASLEVNVVALHY